MRHTLTLFFLSLFCVLAMGQGKSPIEKAVEFRKQHFQEAKSISLFAERNVPPTTSAAVSTEVEDPRFFEINASAEQHILNKQPEVLTFELPVGGEKVLVKLYKRKLYTEGPKIRLGSNPDSYLEEVAQSVYYWGIVDGKTSSLAAFSFSSSGIMGMLSFDQQTWDIGKLLEHQEVYLLYQYANLKKEFSLECGTSQKSVKYNVHQEQPENSSYNPDNCVRVHVEVDYDIFLDKGDTMAAADYAAGAFNEVFILFANEGIDATVSEIFVWDVPSPYPGNSNYLSSFREYRNNNGGINGDIGHLINLHNGGGVAYLDVLCGSNANYAYSGISSSYQQVPTYSWTVFVIAHEMGHNIGANHTHACVWYGTDSPIDCCGAQAGYPSGSCDTCDLPLPSSGTVMSYCHLIGGVGIDLAEGFHPEVGSLFQDKVYNGACLTPCPDEPLLAKFEYDTSDICIGGSIDFVDSSTGGVVAWDWTFPGGDPSTSTLQNPTVYYDQAGSYDVTLVVTDYKGDTSQLTVSDAVTVVGAPTAGFTFDVNGYNVQFTNTSVDAESYFWDFGDGNNSTLENPNHTITQDGVYQVELTASNFCDDDVYTDSVTISNPPIADFYYDVKEGCPTLEVTFDASRSYNATSYFWEFPGGTPDTSNTILQKVSYDSAGTYDVLLIANNPDYSDTLLKKDFINVLPSPEASFTYDHLDSTIEFVSTSLHYDSLYWDLGDSTVSHLDSFTHQYERDSIYDVMLIAINECSVDTIIEKVNTIAVPQASFSIEQQDTLCAPITFQFKNTSIGIIDSFIWIFEGGNPDTSAEEHPTVTYDSAGTYDVLLIAQNPEYSDTLLKKDFIIVSTVPEASFSYIDQDSTITFLNTSQHYDSLYWDLGDSTISHLDSITHRYDSEGIYNVMLIAINDCSVDTFIAEVNAYKVPVASFTYERQDTLCVPAIVQLKNTSEGIIDSFEWIFEGGDPDTSTEENPLVTYDSTGSYPVKLWVQNSAGESELFRDTFIVVNDIPEGNFTYTYLDTLSVKFEGQVIGDPTATIEWQFGNGDTLHSSKEVVYTFRMTGSYEVLFIVGNECGRDTSRQVIELETTSSVTSALEHVRIYPNPANHQVVLDRLPKNCRLEIVGVLGQKVFTEPITDTKKILDVSTWSAGVYYITVSKGHQRSTYRLLVQQ